MRRTDRQRIDQTAARIVELEEFVAVAET